MDFKSNYTTYICSFIMMIFFTCLFCMGLKARGGGGGGHECSSARDSDPLLIDHV